MNFIVDDQTLHDLEIFESAGDQTIFKLFNQTITPGGRQKLYNIMANPLTDVKEINDRKQLIKYFQGLSYGFPFDKNDSDFMEFYLNQNTYSTKPSKIKAVENFVKDKLNPSNDYYIIKRGIACTIAILNNLYEFSLKTSATAIPELLKEYHSAVTKVIENPAFVKVIKVNKQINLNAFDIAAFDHLFRYSNKSDMRLLLDIVDTYDAFFAVAATAKKQGFCYPELIDSDDKRVNIQGLYHPFLKEPVTNNVAYEADKRIIFLTGANMAGKSTFLKSFGISMYLIHLGFPVPATEVSANVFNGLSTTINMPDNLSKGQSHFYSEVLRVKHVAEQINARQNMIVIFDELFRGTNVKDAYEASSAIINAFSKVKNSLFIISTHILEIAEDLKDNKVIDFLFFETKIEDGVPAYNYQLKKGITADRLGMYIIRREKIIEIIESKNSASNLLD